MKRNEVFRLLRASPGTRHRPPAALVAGLLTLAFASPGCSSTADEAGEASRFTPALPDESSPFGPRLLQDGKAIAAYLAAFPRNQYKIYDVPEVGRYYIDSNPAPVKQSLRRGYPWEPHVRDAFKRYVKPGSTVLDIGAHIGSHTVTLARLVGPRGKVYAFEPQRKIFRELYHNLALNRSRNAVPLRFAVSDKPMILEMNPIKGADGHTTVGKGGDRVEARTIDSFGFTNVSVIKIDVEGYELPVLRGAAKTIRGSLPVIIIELRHPEADADSTPEELRYIEEVNAIFKAHGYVVRPMLTVDYHDRIALHESHPDAR
jgi:FkbM family methyltransferase